MASLATLDDVAEMLEATGSFRVLRQVPVPLEIEPSLDMAAVRFGVVVDVEATGPDPERDVPVEIAMIKFAYDSADRILGVVDILLTQGEPPTPLSPDVVALTGLSNADLRGQVIDDAAVAAFLADVSLACSHNAGYDRVILERNLPALPLRPWACSLNDIPWKEGEQQFDRRLRDLLDMHGLFAAGHRAMADCRSLLHILSLPLPVLGRTAFAVMLERARKMSAVFFAEGAPYAATPLLRERGYRWLGSRPDAPRCWARQVPADEARFEAGFLFASVYRSGEHDLLTVTMLSAMHRYRPMAVIAAARVPAPYAPDGGDDASAFAAAEAHDA